MSYRGMVTRVYKWLRWTDVPAVTRHVLRAMRMKKNSSRSWPLNDAPDILTASAEFSSFWPGHSVGEIGTILMISPHTVTAHIKKIYREASGPLPRRRSGLRGRRPST